MHELINRKKLVDLIAERTGYLKYEVNDILLALYDEIRDQVEAGNKVHLDRIGRLYLARPKRKFLCRRQYKDTWLLTDGAPKLRFDPNDTFTKFMQANKHSVKAFVDDEPSIFRIISRVSTELPVDNEQQGATADRSEDS